MRQFLSELCQRHLELVKEKKSLLDALSKERQGRGNAMFVSKIPWFEGEYKKLTILEETIDDEIRQIESDQKAEEVQIILDETRANFFEATEDYRRKIKRLKSELVDLKNKMKELETSNEVLKLSKDKEEPAYKPRDRRQVFNMPTYE
jgi:hypothetical protein